MQNMLAKLKLYGPKKFLYFSFRESINILNRLLKSSFSQNGEDLIIHKILNNKRKGFYIDIGAYDPDRFSNTKYFYNKGWSGINIEPNPRNCQKFLKRRVRDINLNIGIGSKSGKTVFYEFFPDTLSTFSAKEVKHYQKIGFKLAGKYKIELIPLRKIFAKYCQKKLVDFISIDTEGFEMEVLKSNNWRLFRPNLICIESYTFHAEFAPSKERTEIRNFISGKGYKQVFANDTNIIYQAKENIR